MDEPVILELPSDLYSRNLIISDGIKQYKQERGLKGIKILDVGGRNGMLELFLDPDDELTLIDIREGEEENLILGDATDMHFIKDDTFDVVSSGDVFEHVPESRRQLFVTEALRVTSGLVIIAAPFAGNHNQNLEELANSYFKYLTGDDHEWLIEHINNRLPDAGDLESFLRSLGVSFSVSKSNNIDNWMLIQLLTFYLFKFKINDEMIRRFYGFYNKNIRNIEDDNADFYRNIYFISKAGHFDYRFSYDFNNFSKIDLVNQAFYILAEAANGFKEEFGAVHSHANDQEKVISHLESEFNLLQEVHETDGELIKHKDLQILAMKSSIFWKFRELLARCIRLNR